MAFQNLPSIPSFSVHTDTGSIGPRWEKYVRKIENTFVAFKVTDDKQKRALLLHYAGDEVSDISDTLSDTGVDYKTARDKLQSYFLPKRNIEYERFRFRETMQDKDENVDAYNTRLQQLAATCEFHDKEQEVKSQIIRGCLSARVRRRALREELSLTQLLDLARSFEVSESQAQGMEKPSETASVNAIKQQRSQTTKRKQYRSQASRQNNRSQASGQNNKCYNCGGKYPHDKACPAKGKSCNFCKKQNHFAKCCRSRGERATKVKVKAVRHETDSSEGEYVFSVNPQAICKDRRPAATVNLNNTVLPVLIDTGATINVMSYSTYERLHRKPK
ncbi:uncharacterized protein [Ptychodera flava]|uniref:uncharacterized protein n=1 Tax=Ptychodera flava TaxID=63121 RepID=UPI00396A57D1